MVRRYCWTPNSYNPAQCAPRHFSICLPLARPAAFKGLFRDRRRPAAVRTAFITSFSRRVRFSGALAGKRSSRSGLMFATNKPAVRETAGLLTPFSTSRIVSAVPITLSGHSGARATVANPESGQTPRWLILGSAPSACPGIQLYHLSPTKRWHDGSNGKQERAGSHRRLERAVDEALQISVTRPEMIRARFRHRRREAASVQVRRGPERRAIRQRGLRLGHVDARAGYPADRSASLRAPPTIASSAVCR